MYVSAVFRAFLCTFYSYYAASSSTISPPTAVAGNNCNGGGSKASKRQKVSHQFSAKGGRNQNGGCGGGQPTAGQGLQQQPHHAIVPDQLKLYSELIRKIMTCRICVLTWYVMHVTKSPSKPNGFILFAPSHHNPNHQ